MVVPIHPPVDGFLLVVLLHEGLCVAQQVLGARPAVAVALVQLLGGGGSTGGADAPLE